MRRSRLGFLVATLLVCVLSAGCSGAKDKGKNLDYDRPKAPEKK